MYIHYLWQFQKVDCIRGISALHTPCTRLLGALGRAQVLTDGADNPPGRGTQGVPTWHSLHATGGETPNFVLRLPCALMLRFGTERHWPGLGISFVFTGAMRTNDACIVHPEWPDNRLEDMVVRRSIKEPICHGKQRHITYDRGQDHCTHGIQQGHHPKARRPTGETGTGKGM